MLGYRALLPFSETGVTTIKIQKLPHPVYVTRPVLPSIDEMTDAIQRIWESGIVTNFGPRHREFEHSVAGYLKVANASAFVNGHSALESAIRALNISGEVITTPFTFPSTAHAISLAGLEPVFCDIDPNNFSIDPRKIIESITPETSAILAVHVFGNPAEVTTLQEIADANNLKLIYDAAHAFGVEIEGRGIGEFGDLSIFSLHATKVFNAIEGGLVTYADPEYQNVFYKLRNFGYPESANIEDISLVGSNLKLSELHAAVGLLNLKKVDQQISHRRDIYKTYLDRLGSLPGLKMIEPYATRPNYAYCPIVVNQDGFGMSRDLLCDRLAEYNIYCRKYFYPPCNELSCYQEQRLRQSPTPVASSISSNILCLPIYPDLPLETVNHISGIIESLSS